MKQQFKIIIKMDNNHRESELLGEPANVLRLKYITEIKNSSFDIIIVSFVLHHISSNTIYLLVSQLNN